MGPGVVTETEPGMKVKMAMENTIMGMEDLPTLKSKTMQDRWAVVGSLHRRSAVRPYKTVRSFLVLS
jgi:hypothetical protein